MTKILIALFSVLITSSFTVYAQDNTLNEILYDQITNGKNPDGILQPYTDAISSSMNSGLFHTAKVRKNFHMYFGLKGFGTYINDDNKDISELNQSFKMVELAVPQVTLGTVLGTELMVRYLTSISIGNYGAVKIWGVGIRHGITSHFKKPPVDVAVQFVMQTLNILSPNGSDLAETKSLAANLEISKQLSVLTFYTGLQIENTNVDITIKTDQNKNIKKSYDNANKFRAIFGLNLGLDPININGDYSIGRSRTFSAGFGFTF